MLKKKKITVIDGVMPNDEINDYEEITFVIISTNEKLLIQSIESIAKIHKQYKYKTFNIVLSSSYNKLHELSNNEF